MSMQEFRRLAAQMDDHMQRLAAQGVTAPEAIIDRMMAYTPNLHRIWTNTTDDELIALSKEYPGFYRYAYIMEEASEAERRKPSRPYDGMPQFAEHHQRAMTAILTNAATIERGYMAFLQAGKPILFTAQRREIDALCRKWLADIETLRPALRKDGTDVKALEVVDTFFSRMTERVADLARRSAD
jgi:hypothetical protein